MQDYVDLTVWQVALAALLMIVNGVISIAMKLKLERTLLIASLRTVIQLTLVGMAVSYTHLTLPTILLV